MNGGVPEWLKGTDCKSVGSAFGGSNPPPSTILYRFSCRRQAGIAQLVEHQPSKLRVASSSLVSRSSRIFDTDKAHIAQLVERILGKDEVNSSTLFVGSRGIAILTSLWSGRRRLWQKKSLTEKNHMSMLVL